MIWQDYNWLFIIFGLICFTPYWIYLSKNREKYLQNDRSYYKQKCMFIGFIFLGINVLKVIIDCFTSWQQVYRDIPAAFCSTFMFFYLFLGLFKTKKTNEEIWESVNILNFLMGFIILLILFIKPNIFMLHAGTYIIHPKDPENYENMFNIINRVFWHIFVAGMSISWMIVRPYKKINIKIGLYIFYIWIGILLFSLICSWGYFWIFELNSGQGDKKWTGFNDMLYWEGTFKFLKFAEPNLTWGIYTFGIAVSLFYTIGGGMIVLIYTIIDMKFNIWKNKE